MYSISFPSAAKPVSMSKTFALRENRSEPRSWWNETKTSATIGFVSAMIDVDGLDEEWMRFGAVGLLC